MTIEERDTARAIQTIARELKKPITPAPIDWEQRKWDLAKEIFVGGFNSSDEDVRRWAFTHTKHEAQESIKFAELFIEEYRKSQTDKTE